MWCTPIAGTSSAQASERATPGADQQRADQPGTGGIGHAVEVFELQTGLGQGLPDQRQQLAHVVAAGQFRHHPAVFGVQGDLAVDRVGAQSGAARQRRVVDGHAGFVAGGFDAEDAHGPELGAGGQANLRPGGLQASPGVPLSYAARRD